MCRGRRARRGGRSRTDRASRRVRRALRTEHATGDGHHIVRRDARRLVDEQTAQSVEVAGIRGRKGAVLDLREERLDAGGVGDARVEPEVDFRGDAKAEGPAEQADAGEKRGERSPRRWPSSRLFRAHDAHEDARVAEIAGDLDRGDGHEPRDAGILHPVRQEGGDFLADGFGHPVGTARHHSPSVSILAGRGWAARLQGVPGQQRRQDPAASSVRATSSVR